MKLAKKEFKRLLEQGDLTMSLIGMSSIGKTHWSQKLRSFDFKHISCDDLIELKLKSELKRRGWAGIEDVSRWMGQPYDKRFLLNQKAYLRFEKQVMKEILERLVDKEKANIVIDTTGSIVHTSHEICLDLKNNSLIVYIEADESIKEQMFAWYIEEPKPVVWENVFQTRDKETNQEALERCYPKLLNMRGALYTKYADIILPRKFLEKDMSAKEFISQIEQLL